MACDIEVRHVLPEDLPQIFALHALVFGPGRFARTAYRIREGAPLISPWCLKALSGGRIVAAIRFTEIRVGETARALLLGPLAVEPRVAGRGYGRRLVAEGLMRARASGIKLVLLVGDEPYYGRFGFVRVPEGQIELPGPVDPARLLAAELEPGALTRYSGMVRAAPSGCA
jgi:predicted N-acetyltransferase YhbS